MKDKKIKKSGKKGEKTILYKALPVLIYLLILYIMIEKIGVYRSIFIYFIYVLGFAAFRLWKQRDIFIMNVRLLESKIWGKPLDRDLWKPGEMKSKKIKVVWKKPKAEK